MEPSPSIQRELSLADVARGDVVEVEAILFDTVRALLPATRVSPGAVLRCEARTTHEVVCRRPDGRRVIVDSFYASFVAVRRRASGAKEGERRPAARDPARPSG